MRALYLALLTAVTIAPALDAQEGYPRRFRFDFGAGAGNVEHDTEGTLLDGDTDGGLVRLRFEGISRMGIGGGLRFETWGSDDDLFADTGFPRQNSQALDFFGHATYRIDHGKFLMPIRVGLMAHRYQLELVSTEITTLEVTTVGTRFEVAPEVVFNRGSVVEWSAYSEFGLGGGFSSVEIATSNSDFDSFSLMWFGELGARVRYKFAELGLALVTHGMVMDDSDTVGTTFVRGFDADFSGIMFTAAFVF